MFFSRRKKDALKDNLHNFNGLRVVVQEWQSNEPKHWCLKMGRRKRINVRAKEREIRPGFKIKKFAATAVKINQSREKIQHIQMRK
jgi:hypothetical protein